ncbi:MAG: hypothetical protein ACOYNC_06250 [Bacteroidales bacterium]
MTERVFVNCILLTLLMQAHCLASSGFLTLNLPDTSAVAEVNGEEIATPEFLLHAKALRPLIISEFRTKYGAEYGSEFWTREYDGKTPSAALKERTLDTMLQIKVQQISAKKAGLVSDISYKGFLNALKIENSRRLAAKQSGKIIYGPVQYSEEVYYNYLFSNMVNKLKEFLATSLFKVSDKELKEIYENQKDTLFRKGYYTRVRLAKLKEVAIEDSPGKMKKIVESESVLVFNDSLYTPEEEEMVRSMAKAASGKLLAGEDSGEIALNGTSYIIRVIEKVPLGYRSFESCKTAIRIILVDRKYEAYLHLAVKEAVCKINKAVYNNIRF